MKKIGEISPKGAETMVVYYDDKAIVNPYKVYLEWMGESSYGYGLTKRRKLVEKYADLASCVLQMYNFTALHNEEGR